MFGFPTRVRYLFHERPGGAHEWPPDGIVDRELDIAKDIQQLLFPNSCPIVHGFDLASLTEAATEVGGDYFDFIPIDDRRLGIVIADVSDKGVPAALMMAVSSTRIRAIALQGEPSDARQVTDARGQFLANTAAPNFARALRETAFWLLAALALVLLIALASYDALLPGEYYERYPFWVQAIHTALRKADVQTKVLGKGPLPMGGQYNADVVQNGIAKWLAEVKPAAAKAKPRPVPPGVRAAARTACVGPDRPLPHSRCVSPAQPTNGRPVSCSFPMCAKFLAQRMHRPRIVRLHAAFRTSHRRSRLCHVEFFPRPEQEGLLLANRQLAECRVQRGHRPAIRQRSIGTRSPQIGRGGDEILGLLAPVVISRQPSPPPEPDTGPAIPITNPALQDAMEQRRPLSFGSVAIPLNQPEHRLLHQIEGLLLIPGRNSRHPIGAPLDTGQKTVQRGGLVQELDPFSSAARLDRIPYAHVRRSTGDGPRCTITRPDPAIRPADCRSEGRMGQDESLPLRAPLRHVITQDRRIG